MPRLAGNHVGMAKRKSTKLPALTARGKELVAYVLNSVAFGSHADEAELETMAAALGTTPGRLEKTLQKLAEQGYLTIEGKSAKWIYPTVATLRRKSPDLDEKQAAAIIRRLRKG